MENGFKKSDKEGDILGGRVLVVNRLHSFESNKYRIAIKMTMLKLYGLFFQVFYLNSGVQAWKN